MVLDVIYVSDELFSPKSASDIINEMHIVIRSSTNGNRRIVISVKAK